MRTTWIIVLLVAATAVVSAGAPPDFKLRDLEGEWFRLGDHLGEKVIYINFWATWCKPCKRELPHLQHLFDELGEKGFLPIAINTDPASSKSRIKPYVKRHKYKFPFLLDPDNNVHEKFNPTRKLPYSVLVDKDGKIHQIFSGYKAGDEILLRKEILKLLDLTDSAPAAAAVDSTETEGS